MKAKRSIYNIVAAVSSQLVTIVIGFIIPRLTLIGYGSETNGYMNMVAQIYAYIGLFDAGLTTAVVQALYGPVAKNDKTEISSIINAAGLYYKRIAKYYALTVVIASIIIPLVIDSSISKIEMILYFMLFGVSNVINFWFTAAMRTLLVAEGKNYVTSNVSLIFHFLSQGAKVLFLMLGASIALLQLAYAGVNILQITVYFIYFKRSYKWLDKKVPPDNGSIRQRNAFFMQQISNLIFSCTDVMLLSFFCDLKITSVYTVYMLVFNALSTIISIVTSSTQFVLGQTYNSDKTRYVSVHRTYESLLLTFAFTIFTVAGLLTIPFIKIYTSGITDINYIDYVLPILFSLNGLLSTCKSTSLCLINFSFHAKQTINRTFIEAGINLVISILLVPFFGIHGVLIGTGVALIYRLIDTLFYSNRVILKTSIKNTIKLYITNFILFAIIISASNFFKISIANWVGFLTAGVVCTLLCGMIFVTVNVIINIKLYSDLFYFILRKFKGRYR